METKPKETPARDLRYRTLRLTWRGEMQELRFNNNAMFQAEEVYDAEYGRDDCSWIAILRDLQKGKTSAIMAVYYGALKTKFPDLTFQDFVEDFRLDDIPEVAQARAEAIKGALPEDAGEGEGKNV